MLAGRWSTSPPGGISTIARAWMGRPRGGSTKTRSSSSATSRPAASIRVPGGHGRGTRCGTGSPRNGEPYGSHVILARSRGSGLPMPSRRTFATGILPFTHSKETSLRPPGSARFPTPLDWHGQPLAASRSTGFQPVCLSGSHWARVRFRKGEQPDRRHAQKPVRRVPRGDRSGAFEQRTHTSRRRRACRRPAATALRQAKITRTSLSPLALGSSDRPRRAPRAAPPGGPVAPRSPGCRRVRTRVPRPPPR
jgi:hypothetical protein